MGKVKRSLIIPVYNEEKTLPFLFHALRSLLSSDPSWEVVWIDDGSTDATPSLLEKEAEEWRGLGWAYQLIELEGRWGQHGALACGMDHMRGDVAVISDADLQIGLEVVPRIAWMVEEGYDLVSCVRLASKEPWMKRWGSRLVNWMAWKATGVRLKDYGCSTNGFSRYLIEKMREHPGKRLFLKPLAATLARKVAEIEVPHKERLQGESHYSLLDLFSLTLDFVSSYSKRLFVRMALAGVLSFFASIVAGTGYLVLRFLGLLNPCPPFQALLLVCFILSIQMVILGVLGDFIVRIHRKLPSEPLYRISSREVFP